MHETQLHESSYFVTLTYDKAPRELDHADFQLFMKRLRKKHGPIRFYMCGEYGDTTNRPHYHACLFGLHLSDLELYSEAGGNRLYTSETLSAVWTHGYCTIGQITMESAQYVASYCVKKITGPRATEHYTRVDADTGEIYQIKPEYARMSLKPGIAKDWIRKYVNDVYNYDYVIVNGRKQKTPRYYDKHLRETDPLRLEALQIPREQKAKETEGENTPDRLKTIETVTRARLQLKKRTL